MSSPPTTPANASTSAPRFPWWPVIVGATVMGAVVLGLYALTPAPDRASMLRSVGGALAGLVAAGVAALSAWLSHQVRGQTEAQSQQLATIQHQTNGALDRRIREGVAAVLRDFGVNGNEQDDGTQRGQ